MGLTAGGATRVIAAIPQALTSPLQNEPNGVKFLRALLSSGEVYLNQ